MARNVYKGGQRYESRQLNQTLILLVYIQILGQKCLLLTECLRYTLALEDGVGLNGVHPSAITSAGKKRHRVLQWSSSSFLFLAATAFSFLHQKSATDFGKDETASP